MSRKKIAKDAQIKNSKFDCKDVEIENGVKLNDVYIKAKKIKIKANVILTGCKIFSKGFLVSVFTQSSFFEKPQKGNKAMCLAFF